MTVLTGQLVGARDLTVTATFAARLDADGTAGATVAARRDTVADRGGRFRLELPPPSRRQGPITVTALGPNGLPAGEVVVPADVPAGPIRIEVVTAPPTSIRPSTDITLGAQVRYHGRVIDVVGDSVPAGLLLVVWGRRETGEPADPLSVTKTTTGGYFSAPWPSHRLVDAFGVLAGGAPIPILLDSGHLPRQVLLVSAVTPADPAAGTDCTCTTAPPLGSDPTDLAANPEAFTADPGHCIDFTVPDRTVNEVMYQAVVRTTQPQLKAATPQAAADDPPPR